MVKNLLVWFKDISEDDAYEVGNKGEKLGEMARAGFPIAPGFVITTSAYKAFLRENGLETKINHLLGTIDSRKKDSFDNVSSKIKKIIETSPLSNHLIKEIFSTYTKLSGHFAYAPIAVYLSPVTGRNNTSVVGPEETHHMTTGEANLLLVIKSTWASLFDTASLLYRQEHNKDVFTCDSAVVVEKIPQSVNASGKLFSNSPTTNDESTIVINATRANKPNTSHVDYYEIDKKTLTIKSKNIGVERTNKQSQQKISDAIILQLAQLSKKLEKYYYFPQESAWILDNSKIYLLQTKPLTVNFAGLEKDSQPQPIIATKLFTTLSNPKLAQKVAQDLSDGVGLLKIEDVLTAMGDHPKKFIQEEREKEFIQKLALEIEEVCKAFSPRPVVYRLSDLKTNEYQKLFGGKQHEVAEQNPLLGFRGAFRYIHDPEVFQLELAAIKQVRNTYKNLWLMMPFVRTVKELLEVKSLIAASGLYRSSSFKMWLMVEVPSNVFLLDKFIRQGIDGVSIGSHDLTMLMLGVDKTNSSVIAGYNEQDEALLLAYEHVIKTAQKYRISSSFCGQGVSFYPSLLKKLISWGITSVSVNPEVLDVTRKEIGEIEKKLVSNS